MNTDFCGLVLTPITEKAMTFLEWRLLMNGTDNSNMKKIDKALSTLNQSIQSKVDGFIYDETTGEFQLTSSGNRVGEIIVFPNCSVATLTEVKNYIGDF
jgi:hypothetical protein